MARKILIVEDEPAIVTLVQFNLEKAGYETEVAYDGESALKKINSHSYDLIVLDVMLPKMDGMEVCKTLRRDNNYVPVLMLTAKDGEYDKIQGFEIGADDYLTKPFSPKELIARIQAILRRTERSDTYKDDHFHIGKLSIYPKKFEAYFDDALLTLTRKEFELIAYLAEHKGQILSRDQLLQSVWGYDFVGDTRIVDVQVSNLRDKIEADSKNPQYIKTVRGFGYKMEEPV